MDWLGKAEQLAGLLDKALLHARVADLLNRNSSPIGIACSGGIDSMAALLLVHTHLPALRPRITVLHFNHKLRGEASDRDQGFVAAVAGGLKLPVLTGAWEDRAPDKPVTESMARGARQSFYDSFVALSGAAIIVTGHQSNDILETLMLRIARASNLRGLSAPRAVSVFPNGKTIVRPLLNIPKDRLHSAMKSAGIEWREDRSNQESNFDRNKLRNEVIPNWQASTQYNLVQAAAQVRDYLEEAEEVIDRYLAFSRFPPPSRNPVQLPIRLGPRAVVRRWIQLWAQGLSLGTTILPSVLNEMLDTLYSGGKKQWSLGKGLLQVNGSSLAYEANPGGKFIWPDAIPLPEGGDVKLPTGARLSLKSIQLADRILEDLKNGKYPEVSTVLIDSGRVSKNSVFIRGWLPGDRYRPLHSPGTRKLQDMFVDRKITKEERNRLPVVTTGGAMILWCPGLPVNHQLRVTEKTKRILQLTYTDLD